MLQGRCLHDTPNLNLLVALLHLRHSRGRSLASIVLFIRGKFLLSLDNRVVNVAAFGRFCMPKGSSDSTTE